MKRFINFDDKLSVHVSDSLIEALGMDEPRFAELPFAISCQIFNTEEIITTYCSGSLSGINTIELEYEQVKLATVRSNNNSSEEWKIEIIPLVIYFGDIYCGEPHKNKHKGHLTKILDPNYINWYSPIKQLPVLKN